MASTSVSATPILLSSFLDGAFLSAYAIPLLVLSIKAGFLGTFLTLDRTRSFNSVDPPAYDSKHRHAFSLSWRFEGGFGGLIGGWLCGMHLTTYLALLIVNRNSHMSLSPVQFLVIWLLSSIPLALLGGLWRVAASVFYAMIAGASFTSLVDIIFLPKSILPRLIIYAIVTPALLILTLLPNPTIRHWSLRGCTSLSGALGMTIAIALFSKVAPWSSPLLTLAIAPIVGPVDSKEKGLSAALCILTIAGAGCDYLLHRYFGENPDKAWDAYLAKYSQQVPIDGSRAGQFEPYQSFWKRLFTGQLWKKRGGLNAGGIDDMVFPPDAQLLPTSRFPPPEKKAFAPSTPPPSFKPYPSTRSRKRTLLSKSPTLGRKPGLDSGSDTSSDEDEVKTPGGATTSPPKFKPWLMKRSSTGSTSLHTLVGGDALAPPPKLLGTPTIVEEYSDVEQDVTTANKLSEEKDKERRSVGWKPEFLKKAESLRRVSGGDPPARLTDSPTPMSREGTEEKEKKSNQPPITTPATLPLPQLSVPASIPPTPSLIRAIDRISRAHVEAASSTPTPSPLRMPSPQTPLDEGFWEHVRAKAAVQTRT